MNEMWVLALGAAVGGLVQGISGFAFAMVSMAIWLWAIDPALAVVMAVFGGWIGQLISFFSARCGWYPRLLWPLLLGSAVGIPLGTLLVPLLNPDSFKVVLGLLLVIFCSAMMATASLPVIRRGGRIADAGVGLLGGVMAPISSFSGLAPALWCTLRGYSKDEHRSVMQSFNLIVMSVTMALFIATGRVNTSQLPHMAVVAGSLMVPLLYGSKLYIGMSPAVFKKVVLCLLILAGLGMVLSSIDFLP